MRRWRSSSPGRATQQARSIAVPVEALDRETTHAWQRPGAVPGGPGAVVRVALGARAR
jgi:hypothetical protein